MIGEFFSISASNIGHAAIRAASRPISQDEPATIRLASHADSGGDEIYVEVRSPAGFSRDIRIGSGKVHSIQMIKDLGACRAACQEFIDDRAGCIRAAVLEAQADDARDDSHLDQYSDGYVVGGTLTPEEHAQAFIKRPSMFIGDPVKLDRVLAYIHGLETALEMAHGRHPRLYKFEDLLNEIKQELGSDPTRDQELEAIHALEPIMAQVYAAALAAKLPEAEGKPWR